MKCYRVYNHKLKKFAPRGRIDTVKINGYLPTKSLEKQIENFWNLAEWDEPYYKKGHAKRQLTYLKEVMKEYDPFLVIIEFDLIPTKEYTLVDNKLVENTGMLRLIYG